MNDFKNGSFIEKYLDRNVIREGNYHFDKLSGKVTEKSIDDGSLIFEGNIEKGLKQGKCFYTCA